MNTALEFKNYTAIDIVEDCSKYIEKINPNINFIQADIENFTLEFTPDLIISNASLQWVENFEEIIIMLKIVLIKMESLFYQHLAMKTLKK